MLLVFSQALYFFTTGYNDDQALPQNRDFITALISPLLKNGSMVTFGDLKNSCMHLDVARSPDTQI